MGYNWAIIEVSHSQTWLTVVHGLPMSALVEEKEEKGAVDVKNFNPHIIRVMVSL